jgi:hypothetical protein
LGENLQEIAERNSSMEINASKNLHEIYYYRFIIVSNLNKDSNEVFIEITHGKQNDRDSNHTNNMPIFLETIVLAYGRK